MQRLRQAQARAVVAAVELVAQFDGPPQERQGLFRVASCRGQPLVIRPARFIGVEPFGLGEADVGCFEVFVGQQDLAEPAPGGGRSAVFAHLVHAPSGWRRPPRVDPSSGTAGGAGVVYQSQPYQPAVPAAARATTAAPAHHSPRRRRGGFATSLMALSPPGAPFSRSASGAGRPVRRRTLSRAVRPEDLDDRPCPPCPVRNGRAGRCCTGNCRPG